VIYPENFEEKLGFSKIRTKVKEHCLSNLGKSKVDEISFNSSYFLIKKLLSQVEEFIKILRFENDFPVTHFIDVRESLQKIKSIGSFLETEEIFHLKLSLENIHAILRFFRKKEESKYPSLIALTKGIEEQEVVIVEINQILDRKGKIKDNASRELLRIRSMIQDYQQKISMTLQQVLRKARSDGYLDGDASATIRNGRMVIPVSVTHKRKIPGYIQDESATGKTVFIEPSEVVEINNEIRELEYAENREIIKILVAFSDFVRPHTEMLLQSFDFLSEIDFIRAKALFAAESQCAMPVLEDKPYVHWKKARHPLLYLSFKKENKDVVPLDIKLDQTNRILVISGPNAGGKSVCLQTVGLVQYMLQCGLLVPMNENSEAGIFSRIFVNIGDDQSIENDLSTYSSHLHNMKFFYKHADDGTLLLIDEFGAGTEPLIGGAIAESLLDKFNEKHTFGVITTHYTNLKHFASAKDGIVNGAMLFDTDKIEPLFQLQIGEPGSSFAFEIARKIGLNEEILQHATDKVGKKHIDFDKNLKDIIRDKRYYANKRKNIRHKEKQLENLMAKYSADLKSLEHSKKEILKNYEDQAKSTLSGLNKKIENTIQEIRKNQAEKEITRQLREQLEDVKSTYIRNNQDKLKQIDSKIESLTSQKKPGQDQKDKQQGKTGRSSQKEQQRKTEKYQESVDKGFQPGDKVKITGQETAGEIIEVKSGKVLVAFGNIKTMADKDKLIPITSQEYKQKNKRNKSVIISEQLEDKQQKLNFKPNIDIRGKRIDEALQELSSFLDKAIVSDYKELRILHGKGNGTLRQATRDYLNTVEFVNHFKDEHIERGGSGITVVWID